MSVFRKWISTQCTQLLSQQLPTRRFSSSTFYSHSSPGTAIVTGGSRGIGKDIVRVLLYRGYKVGVVSSTSKSIETASYFQQSMKDHGIQEERVAGFECDVGNEKLVAETFAQIESMLGPVNVLVCAAGIAGSSLFVRSSEESIRKTLETNLIGSLNFSKHGVKSMVNQKKEGNIIFIGSVLSKVGMPGQATYAASKSGLVGAARTLAVEYAGLPIRFNVISPGYIDTDMTQHLSDTVKSNYLSRIPLKKSGKVEDISRTVLFVLDCPYLTGQELVIDGGLSL